MSNRAQWSLGIVTVLVIASAAAWWWPSPRDAMASARRSPALAAGIPETTIAPMPVAAAQPAVVAPASTSEFKLVGTVVAARGADSFAMVRRTTDSQLVKLHTGDHVEGLTVGAIGPDRVVLASATQAVVIAADKPAVERSTSIPAAPVPYYPAKPLPEPEPAWAGDPAAFGH